MNKQLEEAIRIIEEAGGFVMMQEDIEDHDAPITEARLIELEAEEQARLTEYQRKRADTHHDLTEALDAGKLSFSRAEDICFENGMDADEIELWIHSHY